MNPQDTGGMSVGLGMVRTGATGLPATPVLCVGTGAAQRLYELRGAGAAMAARQPGSGFEPLARAISVTELLAQGVDLAPLQDLASRVHELAEPLAAGTDDLACPITPGQVFCVGMNIAQLFVPGKITGKMPLIKEAPYAAPFWWMKASSAVTGPADDIIHPGAWHTQRLIPEPELGLVIGRPLGPGIASPRAEESLDYLAGYVIFNDVSALDIEFERGGDPFAFNMAWSKSYPSFAPLGPVLTLPFGIEPARLAATMHVNGEQKVDANTADYLWSPQELVEHFAAVTRLMPGDVIACGNLTGEHRIHPGDRVDIEFERLGRLSNRVAATPQEVRYRVPERVTAYARQFTQTIQSLG